MNFARRRMLGLLLTGLAGGFTTFALAGRALLNVTVPAGKWKAVRLKNLPLDASISLRIESDGVIDVIFIHQDELAKFPAAVNPAFQGTVERSMSFKVVIPKAGNYHVIVDNRKDTRERKVRLDIEAKAAPRKPDGTNPLKTPPKKEQRT